MNTTEQINKHEKAIKLLKLIREATYLQSHFSTKLEDDFTEWNLDRYEVNKKIKERLTNYYLKTFKI